MSSVWTLLLMSKTARKTDERTTVKCLFPGCQARRRCTRTQGINVHHNSRHSISTEVCSRHLVRGKCASAMRHCKLNYACQLLLQLCVCVCVCVCVEFHQSKYTLRNYLWRKICFDRCCSYDLTVLFSRYTVVPNMTTRFYVHIFTDVTPCSPCKSMYLLCIKLINVLSYACCLSVQNTFNFISFFRVFGYLVLFTILSFSRYFIIF